MLVNYMCGLFRSNPKKVAVFLEGNYRSSTGMGRSTLMLCDSMLRADPDLTIVLASSMDSHEAIALIDESFRSRMQVCSLMWAEGVDSNGVRWLRPQTLGGDGFLDCKAWFFFNLPAGGVVAPIRPAVMFCADLLVRVVPEAYYDGNMFGASKKWEDYLYHLLSYRQASLVYATSPRTLRDVISFAGVEQIRTCLAPQFPPINEAVEDRAAEIPFENYFLWTSNDTPHKNHARAFEVLNHYYLSMGEKALPVVMTGPGTRWFSPEHAESTHPYHVKIRNYISDKPHITRNIYFPETLDRSRFLAVLKHASFLWHNVLYDNGTAAVLEAAEYHVPSLVSDYPQMRFFAQKYGVNVDYFSAFNVEEGVSALRKMTAECSIKRHSVAIDYTDENNKFRKWIQELLAANFATEKARKGLAQPLGTRPDEDLLRRNAAKIWPPVSSYLQDFPWRDVPVVGLIVTSDDKEKIIQYLLLFRTLLRERFLDFKLLLILPNADGSLATTRNYILKESLAFDFICVGDVKSAAALRLISQLATYTFCDAVCEKHWREEDWARQFIFLAGPPIDQLQIVAEKIERASEILAKGDLAGELRLTPRHATFVPELSLPPHRIDFSTGPYERYLISGFYQIEDGFRWVTRKARCSLGNYRDDYFGKSPFRNIGVFRKKTTYLRIDSELESLGFDSAEGRPTIDVRLNGRQMGTIELEMGRNEYTLPINDRSVNFNAVNDVEMSANFEYKAGGESSADNRIISWKLFSISLDSRK